jgi:DNA-directed RNA polymerase subunit RPC12/RpoP
MPVIYRCIGCGEIIYAFLRAGQDYYGIPSPSELLIRIGSKCPRCGRKLDRIIEIARIDIKIAK